jgi:type IV pilus assembly protein PilX
MSFGKERGFILVITLMLLIMMAVLTVAMSKGGVLGQSIAGNHREKTRALESAVSALSYAEWWLQQGTNQTAGLNIGGVTSTANCTATTAAPVVCICSTAVAAAQVCVNALASPTTVPWNNTGSTFTLLPSVMSISATGGGGTYYAAPKFYIQYFGASPSTGNNMFQITAYGYGGDANSVAVVQSIFSF